MLKVSLNQIIVKDLLVKMVSLRFSLAQRSYDKPTSSFILPFMEKLASFMSCTVISYINNTNSINNYL